MGERIELSESELKKVAKYMSEEINGNIDAHIAEALRVHSIQIDLKWEQKVERFNVEVHAAFDQQQRVIDDIDQKVNNEVGAIWREIDIIRKDKPVYYLPKKITRTAFWTTFISSIITTIYLLWKSVNQ